MHFVRSLSALSALVILTAGCTCGVLDPAARFACSSTPECGPGYVCQNGECVSESFVSDAGRDGGGGGSDGGGDAGTDAGVDADRDGYPADVDCDDTNQLVNPGALENCSNAIDDDCNTERDCEQLSCNAMTCVGGGTCVNQACLAATEVSCSDGVDNDNDTLIDCRDPDCPVGAQCEDGNMCSTASACVSDGGCAPTSVLVCMSPPSVCYATTGVCSFDAGMCTYAPRPGNCEDGLICTTNDNCNNGMCLPGPRLNCNNPGNQCLSNGGTCVEDAGCVYTPRSALTNCNDNNACTTTDRCDGDGGCVGQPITCTAPSQCHAVLGCAVDAGCQFMVRTGAACDAGIAGTCSPTGTCTPTSQFGYVPSNFTESQLPVVTAPALNITCDASLNTSSNSPSLSAPCVATQPAMAILTSPLPGVPEYLLVESGPFSLSAGSTLTITGTRPVIFAVLGSANISGRVRARNPMQPSLCTSLMGTGANGQSLGAGSGGGGHSTVGGNGGTNMGAGAQGGRIYGAANVIPLLSGCSGGGTNTGGAGGGAIQISARDDVMINGFIAAVGAGGASGTFLEVPGGGGSGGSILLEGRSVMLLNGSFLSTNGGGGAEGTPLSGSGGVDGADGNETSSMPAPGGAGTSSAGNGGNGGSGLAPPQAGFASSGSAGHGSGGGAAGRIRLNATASCQMNGGISPPATSNGAVGCP